MKFNLALTAFALFAIAPVVLAIDEDTRNMELGTFSDQQKPARLKISPPTDTSRAAAATTETSRSDEKSARKARAARHALESQQLEAQEALNAAVAKKDFKKLKRASEKLEKVNAQLRALQ
jgi:hypothetical protein